MRILVTGHHGYIGSVTAPLLRDAGHDVVGLDTRFYRGCDLFPGEEVPALERDVRDVGPRDLEGFDAVVHLAALSNDPLGDLDRELTIGINLDATVALARAALEAGVGRFVFASSCSMYGAAGGDALLDESTPVSPLTAYAESKARSEEALRALADEGLTTVSMRNGTAFGASPRLRLDVVLNNLAAWAHTTGRIRLLSAGTSWRPIVHVRDIAAATLALLEAPPEIVHGQAFNIGSAALNVRIRDLAEVLSGLTGCAVEVSDEATVDPRSYRVDFSKLELALPGFRCEWPVERGAQELLDAYREAGLTLEQFQGDRYVRLARLRTLLDGGSIGPDLRWRAGAAT